MGVAPTTKALFAALVAGAFSAAPRFTAFALAGEPAAGSHAVTDHAGEVLIDFSAGTVDVPGSGAADPHAPNAQVARVKAERTARTDAGKRLQSTLSTMKPERLGCAPSLAKLDEWVASAPTSAIDWGSDGSVRLTLRLPLTLIAPADATVTGAAQAAIIVDSHAHPILFVKFAGGCVAAPRFFERLADARAAGGELTAAAIVKSESHHSASTTASASEGVPEARRVVAVVRREP